MGQASNERRRSAALSDADLLRAIGRDLRAVYAEVIREPLPGRIERTLARIDREQGGSPRPGRQAAH